MNVVDSTKSPAEPTDTHGNLNHESFLLSEGTLCLHLSVENIPKKPCMSDLSACCKKRYAAHIFCEGNTNRKDSSREISLLSRRTCSMPI